MGLRFNHKNRIKLSVLLDKVLRFSSIVLKIGYEDTVIAPTLRKSAEFIGSVFFCNELENGFKFYN